MFMGWIKEFRAFAMRGNVIDLAVGIIIGAAFTSIVDSLVKDIFTPPIGWVLGGLDFSNLFISLKGSYASLDAAQKAGAPTINYGLFINACIKFMLVTFALFILIKQVNRLKAVFEAEQAAAPPPPSPPSRSETLLAEIRDLLKSGR